MESIVFWNDSTKFSGKFVDLEQSYGQIPKDAKSDVDIGIAPFFSDKEMTKLAGFVTYTDNILSTSVLPNGKKIVSFIGSYNFNLPTGIINTISSSIDRVDYDGYFLDQNLFNIIGGSGSGLNSKGSIVLDVIDNKYRWSVYLS